MSENRSAGISYKWAVMFCLLPAITLVTVDMTVVNVALAKLGAVFGVDVATVGWTVTGFSLAMGIATPLAGFAESRFSTKRVWLVSLALFTGGSFLCGIAPSFSILIVGRLIQGLGGGILFSMAMGLLFRVFPLGERGGAMGLMAIPMVAGPAFGPTVGGYIVTNLDWRVVFFINLPVGALALAMAAVMLRPSQPRPDFRLDLAGAVLSSLGFGSLLYGLSRVSQDGWGSMVVLGCLGVGLVTLFGFELTRAEPLLDVRLFALPQFLIGNVVTWVGSIALMGAEFMLPLYLQNLRGLTALDTGITLMPQGFAVALSSPIAGKLIDKVGARTVAVCGIVLLALNTWDMSQITLETPFSTLRWLLVVRGLALGFVMAPPKLTAMEAAPAHLQTNASSLLSAMQSVFQSLGVALLATVVQTQSIVHTVVLGWQVSAGTMPGAFLGQIDALLQASRGMSASSAHLLAVELILSQVRAQAAVLAFADAYRITFFAALLTAGLTLLLPGRRVVKASSAKPTAIASTALEGGI